MASLDTPVTHLKHREGMMTDRKCPNSRPRQHAQNCSYYLRWALSVLSQAAGAPSVFLQTCFTSGLFGWPLTVNLLLLKHRPKMLSGERTWQLFHGSRKMQVLVPKRRRVGDRLKRKRETITLV